MKFRRSSKYFNPESEELEAAINALMKEAEEDNRGIRDNVYATLPDLIRKLEVCGELDIPVTVSLTKFSEKEDLWNVLKSAEDLIKKDLVEAARRKIARDKRGSS